MKHRNTEMIVDESCVEIAVTYSYEWIDGNCETDLESVEVIIAGQAVDILKQLSIKQENKIIQQLNYK